MLSGKDEITEVQARRWSFRNILKQRGLERGWSLEKKPVEQPEEPDFLT